jgi:hypothetical protein
MPRYLSLWEIDPSKMPNDPKERLTLLKKMSDMTKKTLKEHPGSEWGAFVGENGGFSISSTSATPVELTAVSQMFLPYVQFKVHQVISSEEFDEVFKALQQQK